MRKNALIMLFLATSLFAVSTEDFFYQRGYENGYNKGFEVGVQKAFEESKKVLERYRDELAMFEIGKYLIRSKYLTFPQVWQETDTSGSIKLRVSPSRLERPLDVDALFTKFSQIPLKSGVETPSLELSLEEKNSIYLSARDSNANDMAQSVDESIKTKTLNIEKTAGNLNVLKKANVVFSDEGSSYKVLFFTQQEKNQFCNAYKICGK